MTKRNQKIKWAGIFTLLLATAMSGKAQTSQVLPWNDPNAYDPMPVICVHGLGSDSVDAWATGVDILKSSFSSYYFQGGSQVSQQRSGQPGAPYVETFDYGEYRAMDFWSCCSLFHGRIAKGKHEY